MRKILVLVTLLALFGLVSCTDNLSYQDTSVQEGAPLNLTAYLESSYETKTGLVDNGSGGKSVVWRSGDAISLFFNSGSDGGDKFTTTTSGPIASFSGSLSAISGSLSSIGGEAWFWATYPYNASASCDGNALTTELSVSQPSCPGDVMDNLLVTVGRSENMAIYFRSICAVIGFTVCQEGITRIIFEGNAGETVSGGFSVSFDEDEEVVISPTDNSSTHVEVIPASSASFEVGTRYYFAILPGAYSSGYKLIFERNDRAVATYVRQSSFTFGRSTFYTMTNKDEGLSFLPPDPNTLITFEDANFKAYCVENYDTNKDGDISIAEAEAVTYIICLEKGIQSLSGIEFFYNLNSLYCHYNQLSSLDVSKNKKLKSLGCAYNQLTSLDVSKNTALTSLQCGHNQLTSLDVSKNIGLLQLKCGHNQLTSLDVSKNNALTSLECGHNGLTSLDISNNTSLLSLYCQDNHLLSLVISNNEALTTLNCKTNHLETLDISNNNSITSIDCSNNQLFLIDLGENAVLAELLCDSNKLESLEIGNNTGLTSLSCQSNHLLSLDVSKNTALIQLWCGANHLSVLDVSKNTALTVLSCGANRMTSLDVSKNIGLLQLECEYNQLTGLDVSNNTSLSLLCCDFNPLVSLDVSNNLALTSLSCISNPNLTEIWLKTGQIITNFNYDTDVATIKYKD